MKEMLKQDRFRGGTERGQVTGEGRNITVLGRRIKQDRFPERYGRKTVPGVEL